jgi:hypothetical protein
MTKAKTTKQYMPQIVADAEQTLAMLQEKRAGSITRGAELDERRRFAAYAAHAQLDPAARDILDKVNAEVGVHSSELRSIDDAIAEAQTKVMLAKAYQDELAAAAKTERIRELAGALRECGIEMGDAARSFTEQAKLLDGILVQLHGLGITTPSWEQHRVLGNQCLRTMIMASPGTRALAASAIIVYYIQGLGVPAVADGNSGRR